MLKAFRQFDTYSLKARVFPALISGLPVLALLSVVVPWDHFGLSQATAGAMGLILLFAFADIARRTGRTLQAKLGTGTTPGLWYRSDAEIPGGAKDRYRAFVAKKIKLDAPTPDEEANDPRKADDFYNSAGNWLREHTRDQRKFAILFGENITYGYCRNLLGLKPVALCFNVAVLAIGGGILYFKPAYFSQIIYIEEKLTVILIAAVLHSAFLLSWVNAKAVREASRAYGRQLILCCETLMKPAPAAPRAPKKG